jgi:hypothetical protein
MMPLFSNFRQLIRDSNKLLAHSEQLRKKRLEVEQVLSQLKVTLLVLLPAD